MLLMRLKKLGEVNKWKGFKDLGLIGENTVSTVIRNS
jgi:hypothetical protein